MIFFNKVRNMFFQRTLSKPINCSGAGLHTGKKVEMILRPAPANTGIVFVRTDAGNIKIEATLANVGSSQYATCLEKNGISISTAEHLLAALYALGVDNVRIEMNAEEVPILDGSSAPFVQLIQKTGLKELTEPRLYIVICRPISVKEEEDKRVSVYPCDEFKVTYAIDFEHHILGYQELTASLWGVQAFAEKIAPARTFTLKREIEVLRKKGLARGGSLENAVVIGEKGILNKSLRFKDEFVRHKMLDLTGDLSLVGKPVKGHVIAYRAGHDLHSQLAQKIVQEKDSWYLSRWIEEEHSTTFSLIKTI
jgi:UDP-3-O-[3-hydroxymyristoyl] N-acetylglucosamine deacetylase